MASPIYSVATIVYSTPEMGVRGSIAGLEAGTMGSWYANPKYGGAGKIQAKISELSGIPVTNLNAQEEFNKLNTADQTEVVKEIYAHEGGTQLFQERLPVNIEAQVRSFANSISGLGTENERKSYAKDLMTEIRSGRAKTPQEAKRNLGTVTDEDKEVKKRITGEITPLRKDTNEILRNADNIKELTKISGGIGDTAAVTAFLKTIDPGSVARESEVAGVENARGLIDNVTLWFEKLGTGARLSADQKKQLSEVSDTLGDLARGKMYETLITRRQELFNRGVEPTVISDFEIKKLERDMGKSEVNKIRQENGLETLPLTEGERAAAFLRGEAPAVDEQGLVNESDLGDIDAIFGESQPEQRGSVGGS